MRYRQVALGAVIVAGMMSVASTSALAWGCVARGNGTSHGYSYRYNNRYDAQDRALRECVNRPYAGRCYIVRCNPYD